MIIYEITLLREEVRSLREANQALSKRRRAKKTRVRAGGALSVQDALDLIESKVVEGSEKDQTSSDRGGKQTGSSTSRRCSKCGKAGHNVRICQEVEEISEEDIEIESD